MPGLRRLLLPWVRHECRRRLFPGVDEKDAAEFARLLHALSAVDFELMRAAVRRPLPPAPIAYARDDHMIETAVAEELAAAVPGARVLAFDDGGHNIQKTRAAELGAAIREVCVSYGWARTQCMESTRRSTGNGRSTPTSTRRRRARNAGMVDKPARGQLR